MNKQEKIEELKKEIEELENQLNERGKELYNDYNIAKAKYLSDLFHEYADSNTSIYYSDIEEYYRAHIWESTEALKEFGYTLNDFHDLEEAMHKGAQLAEYNEIYSELVENESIFEELIEKFEELEELEKEEEE